MADDEISFAMVRLGYYEDKDPYFDQNMKDADEAGIKTGGLLFTNNATTVQEVKKKLSMCWISSKTTRFPILSVMIWMQLVNWRKS